MKSPFPRILASYWRRLFQWLLGIAVVLCVLDEIEHWWEADRRPVWPVAEALLAELARGGVGAVDPGDLEELRRDNDLESVTAAIMHNIVSDAINAKRAAAGESVPGDEPATKSPDSPDVVRKAQLEAEMQTQSAAVLVEWLARLPNLRVLSLDEVPLGDSAADVLRVVSRLEHLEVLSLGDTGTTADSLSHLSGLKRLRVLDLSGCEVTGPLSSLASLPQLRTLILRTPPATDEQLEDLLNLPQVESITIGGDGSTDSISEAGIAHLAAHPGLRELVIFGDSSVSSRELQTVLAARLPHVTVWAGYREWESETREIDRSVSHLIIAWMLFFCVCHFGLMPQLLLPIAGVIPRYIRQQLVLPGLGLAALTVAGLLVAMSCGLPLEAAVAVTCLGSACGCTMLGGCVASSIGRMRWTDYLVILGLPLIGVVVLLIGGESAADWLSTQPGLHIATVLSVLGLAATVWREYRTLMRVPRLVAESDHAVTLSFGESLSTGNRNRQRSVLAGIASGNWWSLLSPFAWGVIPKRGCWGIRKTSRLPSG
jgi:hypothetical protein